MPSAYEYGDPVASPRLHPDGVELQGMRMLRAKGRPEIWISLRPARPCDGEALQAYVRALSPASRYNRFLGAVGELSASELTRAVAANGRDTSTFLLAVAIGGRETIVGEARTASFCAERVGEFSLSVADGWQGLGLGAALLEEIENKAAADGVERIVGDVLRTNSAMIALARSRGFRLGTGLEGRLLRVQKRLDAAPDLPCLKWAEIAGSLDPRHPADRA